MYGDGAGLFLNIGPTGAKSWIFRYSSPTIKRRKNRKLGQQRDMGIGPLHTIGLADAREKAVECRKLVLAGLIRSSIARLSARRSGSRRPAR